MDETELSKNRELLNRVSQDAGDKQSAHQRAMPADVPVFNCIVYVSTDADGGVCARVANLAGLSCQAGTEREALAKIVPSFKKLVSELMQAGTPIPWLDPPSPAEPKEQTRFIAVHL